MSDVILVTEHFPPGIGGSAVLFHGVYSRMSDRRVLVVTNQRPLATDADKQDPLQIVPHPLTTSRWGISHPSAVRHHARVAGVVRALARGRDAIVHCGRALPEGVAAWMARRLGGPRYVCWAHGEDLVSAQTSRELTFIVKRVLRGGAAAIANSRNTAALLSALGVNPRRIHIVYPGVDAERFHPAVDGHVLRQSLAAPGEIVLLSVGRLQRRKGHDVVLRALANVGGQSPSIRYVIAGDGEERQRLEQLAASCGVAERVHFAGAVSPEDLPRYYAASDMFVMPNRAEANDLEGFGIVFLEAAASGRPVIGGRSGGVPEAVIEGQTGLLVGGTDVDELAAAILALARSSELRARLADAGRARVVKDFSWARAASAVSAVQRAVSAKGSGVPC